MKNKLEIRTLFNTPGYKADVLTKAECQLLAAKIKEIGKAAYEQSGHAGLLELHGSVYDIKGAARFAELAFSGIGEWLG